MIKSFLIKLFNLLKRPIQDTKNNRPLDVILSLTNNYEIDLSILMQPDLDNLPPDQISETAEKYAEFFHILTSPKLKPQIIEILVDQIKTEKNAHFINNIIVYWSIIEKEFKRQMTEKRNSSFIKPSQVFHANKN